MSRMRVAALAYARRGWPVFPVRMNGKEPLTEHGVLDATTDPTQIEEWWNRYPSANIGVDAYGANLLVLDYDPGHDAEEVRAALGDDPPLTSLRTRTPRGGQHHFYSLPPDTGPIASSASPFAKNVDVRCFHGYVLLPPSATTHGDYEWIEESNLEAASVNLIDACRKVSGKDPERDEWLVEPDLEENVNAAVRWLREEAQPALEGRGGDNMTYKTAAHMRSYGLSEEMTLEVMAAHYNPDKCIPPWDQDELATKVRNGHAYAVNKAGNISPVYKRVRAQGRNPFIVRSRDIGEGIQYTGGRFRVIDRLALEALPEPEWLIPDFILEGGYAILAGQEGTYKTFLALDAALMVATGPGSRESGPWLGVWQMLDQPGKHGPVLYVAGEGRLGLRSRVLAWERFHGAMRTADFYLADPVPLASDSVQAREEFIETALKINPCGYRLVVIDTIGRAMMGSNENQQEDASRFTLLAQEIQRRMGQGEDRPAAVLALHHTSDKDKVRGSTVFRADTDTVVISERKPGESVACLWMQKQKDKPQWNRSKLAELKEVEGGGMVIVSGGKAPSVKEAAREAKQKHDSARKRGRPPTDLNVLARWVENALRTKPGGIMSTNDLCERIAKSPDPNTGERSGIAYRTAMDNLERLFTEGDYPVTDRHRPSNRWTSGEWLGLNPGEILRNIKEEK